MYTFYGLEVVRAGQSLGSKRAHTCTIDTEIDSAIFSHAIKPNLMTEINGVRHCLCFMD